MTELVAVVVKDIDDTVLSVTIHVVLPLALRFAPQAYATRDDPMVVD